MSTNPYTAELVQRIDNRYAVDAETMSLSDWICANTHLKGKKFTFNRYPFQEQIASDLHPNMDVIKCSQVGLALALDTPVPTSTGWTTMGEVQVGDHLFDEQGQPTKVTYVSPIYTDRDCYEITFCDDQKVIADGAHRWYVEAREAFNETGLRNKRGRPPLGWASKGVLSTEVIAKEYTRGNKFLFAIPMTKAISCRSVVLPLDPYFLGLWLGDGNAASTGMTAASADYLEYRRELEGLGFSVSSLQGVAFSVDLPHGVKRHRTQVYNPETATLYGVLNQLGLISNKHVPAVYLRAPREDRLSLLQGLLDTDGSITKRGRISFYNTNPRLVQAFEELAASLGFKCRTRWRSPTGIANVLKNGHAIISKLDIAEVSFVAYRDQTLFRLPRKQARVGAIEAGRPSESFRRRIVDVQKIASVPTRCLTVDSPNHLFLAGRGMIPTHNTEIQIRKIAAFLARHRGTTAIFTLPTDAMFERTAATRILPLIKEEKCFNLESSGGDRPIRSKSLIQIATSFLHVTGAKEGDATSISADVVFNDEVDLSDQQMMALFNSRLQDSDWKINQRFSTPTFSNFGIDAGYQGSDQHEYLCKCDACNHWQAPLFEEKFIHLPGLPDSTKLTEIDTALIDSGRLQLENSYVCCEKCGAPLDLGRRESREWVARYASRSHHRGYRVSPFSTDRLPPSYIISQMLLYKSKDFLKGWYNTVLGLPFNDGNARLGDDVIAQCFTPQSLLPANDTTIPTWLGIDVGQICHVTVGQGYSREDQHIIRFMAVPVAQIFEVVQELLDTFNVIGGACDRHPYTPTADALFSLSKGKIVPVEYRGQKELNLVSVPPDPPTYAQANRTILIDDVARVVRSGRIKFSGYGVQKGIISDHLKDMVRDEAPEQPATWVKLTGNDHYFHSLGFLLISIKIMDALLVPPNPRSSVALATADMRDDRLGSRKR